MSKVHISPHVQWNVLADCSDIARVKVYGIPFRGSNIGECLQTGGF